MKKYLSAVALSAFLLTASVPAKALNDFIESSMAEITAKVEKRGMTVEKLSPEDVVKIDNEHPRPDPLKDGDIYLVTSGNTVILFIVEDDKVIFSSNPIKIEIVNKVLGRTGA